LAFPTPETTGLRPWLLRVAALRGLAVPDFWNWSTGIADTLSAPESHPLYWSRKTSMRQGGMESRKAWP